MPHALAHLAHALHQLALRSGVLTHPRTDLGVLAGVLIAAGTTAWIIIRRRPSAAEIERRRREQLGAEGRLTDGVIIDAKTLRGEDADGLAADVLVYTYRLGGVIYNCAQDVSELKDRVSGYRLDQPVQVRYDPRHPGNSILVSERWSGLRLLSR
jgi:hypothetical protein